MNAIHRNVLFLCVILLAISCDSLGKPFGNFENIIDAKANFLKSVVTAFTNPFQQQSTPSYSTIFVPILLPPDYFGNQSVSASGSGQLNTTPGPGLALTTPTIPTTPITAAPLMVQSTSTNTPAQITSTAKV